jgi:hypothetical protein
MCDLDPRTGYSDFSSCSIFRSALDELIKHSDEMNHEPLNPNDVLEEAITTLQNKIKANTLKPKIEALKRRHAEELKPLEDERNRLEWTLEELAENTE